MKRESAPSRLLDLRQLGRHQVAAALATGIDFAAMVGLVELASLAPPYATVLSAVLGGAANFALGRAWAFRSRHRGSLGGQAARYAVVCAGGALLNGTLLAATLAIMHGAIRPFGASYVLARAVVSLVISVAYTYPMHTRVVFRAVRDDEPTGGASEAA